MQKTEHLATRIQSPLRRACWVLLAIIALSAVPARARLRDIQVDKLPQHPEIQKAYKSALGVEAMAEEWSLQWRYSTPRATVAATLKTCLKELQDAERATPNNEELWLLTGTIASYAYNLDVDGAYDTATAAMNTAHSLAPNDPRPEWILGSFYCGTSDKLAQGMDSLLKVESQFDRQQLSPDFWESYMTCATLTNMPAHVLRAADQLRRLGPLSATAKWQVDMAAKHIVETSVTKSYTPQEVWSANKTPVGTEFFSHACGFGFLDGDKRDWQIYGVRDGVCMIRAKLGPFQGKAGSVFPEIMVLARPPKPGETLNDFSKVFTSGMGARPTEPVACPVSACLAFKTGTRANMYSKEDGGYAMLTVFESHAPRFPGLIFEEPRTPPVGKSGAQAQYFRPNPEQQRLAGTLYYLVLLDTAESVVNEASDNYIHLLKSLVVDTKRADQH